MDLSRALRKSISRMLMGVLLFAQVAVAGYACPSLKGMDSATRSATLSVSSMPPGCDEVDPDATNLCAEHCRQGQQSVDTAATPAMSAGLPTFLYAIPIEPQHALGSGRSFPASDASRFAAPEPPHSILHCVFRI